MNPVARRRRLLTAATGYLELELPKLALECLSQISEPESDCFEFWLLKGLAFRSLDEFRTALKWLEKARALSPGSMTAAMAAAWCYKRTGKLQEAIAATYQAYESSPREAVLLYNLACYWCLAGDKQQALSWLGRSLRIDGSYRALIADEPDFDSLRNDPDFLVIVRTPAGE